MWTQKQKYVKIQEQASNGEKWYSEYVDRKKSTNIERINLDSIVAYKNK